MSASQLGARWPDLPRLTDADRARVHELLDKYAAERERRRAEHVARIRRVACSLGRRVAAYEVTLADAKARLRALALTYDRTCPTPLLLLPYADAVPVIAAAYAAGYREQRKGAR